MLCLSHRIHSKKIKVRNLDVSYLAGGEGEPLVVVHGGGDGARAWLRNARELSRHYSVYIPDLPGFGESQPMDGKFGVSEFAGFVNDFAHSLGLERFHLVGHSVGGGIALHCALSFPERVNRLVLVNSLCLGKEIALWVRFLSSPAFCKSLGEIGVGVFRAVRWLAGLFYAPFKFVNPVTRVKIDIGSAITTLQGQTTVLFDRLSELVAPTLLVWGARDNIVPAIHAYAAARVIPDCRLHIFEDCGHSVYRDRAAEFSRLLADFLGQK